LTWNPLPIGSTPKRRAGRSSPPHSPQVTVHDCSLAPLSVPHSMTSEASTGKPGPRLVQSPRRSCFRRYGLFRFSPNALRTFAPIRDHRPSPPCRRSLTTAPPFTCDDLCRFRIRFFFPPMRGFAASARTHCRLASTSGIGTVGFSNPLALPG